MSITKEKKLTLIALILMVFSSVFGFANMPRSYYILGYAAIPWYVISAVLFFIPYAFMVAEYGAAFKNESGGIYSWMKISVNPKYAFVATFMWYASYIIWMVGISSTIWIVISTALFGKDLTKHFGMFGLSATQVVGILGILLMISITALASKGLNKITKITSIGGIAVTLLNIVLLVGALFILVLNHGHLAQPFESFSHAFTMTPHPDYQGFMGISSFLVFAIFAYGGIEVVGGVSDKTQNAETTFPRGVALSAFVIAIGYAIGIFMCGIFINWDAVLSDPDVNMANVAYVVMENLGYQIGVVLHMSDASAHTLGLIVSRYVGISMVLSLTGAFFILCYSPLKQLIEGTPKELWPASMQKLKNGMPVNAMWAQCAIVVVFIAFVAFGGDGASRFFSKLVLMTNVAMTIPYIFIAAAFPIFKANKSIKKPFEVYKNRFITILATVCAVVTVGFANIATVISPALNKQDYSSTIWMVMGPVFFTILALVIYKRYEIKHLKK